jgi:hypothetical protein
MIEDTQYSWMTRWVAAPLATAVVTLACGFYMSRKRQSGEPPSRRASFTSFGLALGTFPSNLTSLKRLSMLLVTFRRIIYQALIP